jgi:hypothetical protein
LGIGLEVWLLGDVMGGLSFLESRSARRTEFRNKSGKGGAQKASRAHLTPIKSKRALTGRRDPFDGRFVVSEKAFALIEECLNTPEEPSALTLEAEQLVNTLLKRKT